MQPFEYCSCLCCLLNQFLKKVESMYFEVRSPGSPSSFIGFAGFGKCLPWVLAFRPTADAVGVAAAPFQLTSAASQEHNLADTGDIVRRSMAMMCRNASSKPRDFANDRPGNHEYRACGAHNTDLRSRSGLTFESRE